MPVKVESCTVEETGSVLYGWGAHSWRYAPAPDALTLGYGNRPASHLIPTLQQVNKLNFVLVDIRLDPVSKREEWNSDALLARLSRRYYCHLPALGNLNHVASQRHRGIVLANQEAGMAHLALLMANGYTPVLFSDVTHHVSHVADLLRAEKRTVTELDWKSL